MTYSLGNYVLSELMESLHSWAMNHCRLWVNVSNSSVHSACC